MEPITSPDEPWIRSHLFTVRVWYEQTENDAREIRIQARHVVTGETHYFRTWQGLIDFLSSKLQ